jgi:hypothetical protein
MSSAGRLGIAPMAWAVFARGFEPQGHHRAGCDHHHILSCDSIAGTPTVAQGATERERKAVAFTPFHAFSLPFFAFFTTFHLFTPFGE